MNNDRIQSTCASLLNYAGVIFVHKRLYLSHKYFSSLVVCDRLLQVKIVFC